MNGLNGCVALVTGATRGIGAAISKKLVNSGIKVVGCARNVQNAETKDKASSQGLFHLMKCDVSKENDVLSMFDEIKRKHDHIDIFINNAGVINYAPIMNGKISDWRNIIEVNVLGMCLCTREAVKLMKEKSVHDGIIIQIGGIGGHKIASIPKGLPDPGVALYNGTKFMVRALTEALRQELKTANSRIRVSAISPGPVKTAMLEKAMDAAGRAGDSAYPKSAQYLLPEDVAEAVAYILNTKPHVNVDDIVIQSLDFHV